MNTIASIARLVGSVCLGIYTGAMLTEGLLLVPWWRSLTAADFLAWYAANDARLLAFFSPLTTATAVTALAAAAASLAARDRARMPSVAAFVLVAVCVAMFFVYFEAANASFSAGTLAADALAAELARWETWHHVRTLLSAAAFVLSLVALRRGPAT